MLHLGKDSSHQNCKKFQLFLWQEFCRIFRMYSELGKKETDTSERLLRALERCDELDYEVQRLRNELSEYQFYEYDLWIFALYCFWSLIILNIFCLVLDFLEEELFNARERIIEISISKDHLFDSVLGLEIQLHQCRKRLKKLQKQYDLLLKLHNKCKRSQIIIYR